MKAFEIHSSNRNWTIEKPSKVIIADEYRSAIQCNDLETADKLRALFQLSVLEEDLALTKGDETIPQLGGIHGQIKGKIPGFESHHIPAQSIQDEKADRLPAIAISAEDHKLTDSYAGKAHSRFQSFLPDVPKEEAYKTDAASMIADDRYMELVRLELFNIKDRCGNKYDGAIQQYMDALTDYIAEHGTPEACEPERGKEQTQMEQPYDVKENTSVRESESDAPDESDAGSAKNMKHIIPPPSFIGRGEDTMTVLENYRDNLRNRGVSETQIERFVSEERDKMQREYNDRDQNKEDPYIYHDPQDWNAVASALKQDEAVKRETIQQKLQTESEAMVRSNHPGWNFNMEPADSYKAAEKNVNFDMRPTETLNQETEVAYDPQIQNEENHGMAR